MRPISLSPQESTQYESLKQKLAANALRIGTLRKQHVDIRQLIHVNAAETELTGLNTQMAELIFETDEELEALIKQAYPSTTIKVKALRNEEVLEISFLDIILQSDDQLVRLEEFDKLRANPGKSHDDNNRAAMETMEFYHLLESGRQIMQEDCGSKGYLILKFEPKERAVLIATLNAIISLNSQRTTTQPQPDQIAELNTDQQRFSSARPG